MTFVRVFHGLADRELCSAGNRGAEFEPAYVENIECDLCAVANVTDEITNRNLCIG